ncbi:MAB_1171c family putative transporter [Nocardia sp. NPDC051052]|uniref:MAB_1171c family putative transporter n=1 Tax=Nocardia sp. NPDC051052 TaxID=3364322 RepID=UPI00379F775B
MATKLQYLLSGFLCIALMIKIVELALSARRDQRTTMLIVSLLSFTIAGLAGIPPLRKYVPFTNIPGVAAIIMDTGVSISLALLAAYLLRPLGRGLNDVWWRSPFFASACVASAIMATLMVTTPAAQRTNPLQNQYTGDWKIVGIYIVGNLFFLYCSGTAALACFRITRVVRGYVAIGVGMGAIGMTAYAITCINRLALVAAQLMVSNWFAWYSVLNFIFTQAAVIACVLGLHFTSLWNISAAIRRCYYDFRAFRSLGPIWRLLTAAFPDVILPPGRGPSGLRDRIDIPYRKYRRAIECQDALLLLGVSPTEGKDRQGHSQDAVSHILSDLSEYITPTSAAQGAGAPRPIRPSTRALDDQLSLLRSLLSTDREAA